MKRRGFLKASGAALALATGLPSFSSNLFANKRRRGRAVDLINTARNLIYIHLDGGASHVDTFDIKQGRWTVADLAPDRVGGFLDWPVGTMPKLAERHDRFTILRSISTKERVHNRAIYQMTTSYSEDRFNTAFVPHFASLLSYYLSPLRQQHLFPFGVTFKGFTRGNMRLDLKHRLTFTGSDGNIANILHQWPEAQGRFSLHADLLPGGLPDGDPRKAFSAMQRNSAALTLDESLLALANDRSDFPQFEDTISQAWATQCFSATKLIGAGLGTHVAELSFNGWDHHTNIYHPNRNMNLIDMSKALDNALSYLFDLLESKPSPTGEGSLFDDTLVVVGSEFSRTPGELNLSGGREHFSNCFSYLFAGGGVRGSQVLGATNDTGLFITDAGWNGNRFIDFPDLLATIYSALGVDWHQELEYVPNGQRWPLVQMDSVPNHIEHIFRG